MTIFREKISHLLTISPPRVSI
uniref:Uncharacterized protein n=1 Tax=Rhizophora mucronata TaxID=61149 RepID=A0A2P2NVJ2_RHIMU